MQDIININLDYEQPIKIADDVYWVGFFDKESGLHCNPYLIVDNEEAVLIDGGSHPDFPSVMMKILQTGLSPRQIKALIYQHYDPDLVGGVSNFENLVDNKDLIILSHRANHMFIRHYDVKSPLVGLEQIDSVFRFTSGRELRFISTPYAHSAGSFVTFDPHTQVLFSSDLFGSYGKEWKLFLQLGSDCHGCNDYDHCPVGKSYCPLPDLLNFHLHLMPSEKSLRWAMRQLAEVPFSMIAPQHGSIIADAADADAVMEKLLTLEGVGMDHVYKGPVEMTAEQLRELRGRLNRHANR